MCKLFKSSYLPIHLTSEYLSIDLSIYLSIYPLFNSRTRGNTSSQVACLNSCVRVFAVCFCVISVCFLCVFFVILCVSRVFSVRLLCVSVCFLCVSCVFSVRFLCVFCVFLCVFCVFCVFPSLTTHHHHYHHRHRHHHCVVSCLFGLVFVYVCVCACSSRLMIRELTCDANFQIDSTFATSTTTTAIICIRKSKIEKTNKFGRIYISIILKRTLLPTV